MVRHGAAVWHLDAAGLQARHPAVPGRPGFVLAATRLDLVPMKMTIGVCAQSLVETRFPMSRLERTWRGLFSHTVCRRPSNCRYLDD